MKQKAIITSQNKDFVNNITDKKVHYYENKIIT